MKKIIVLSSLTFIMLSCKKEQLETQKIYHAVDFKTNSEQIIEKQLVERYQKLSKPDVNLTKDGYGFVEWQLKGERYNFDRPLEEDITLEAKWGINVHSVKIDFSNGSPIEIYNLEEGDTLKKVETPKKSGYVFLGWNSNGQKFDIKTPIKENISLVAEWLELTPEVVFTQEQRKSMDLMAKTSEVISNLMQNNPSLLENPKELMKKFGEAINKEYKNQGIDFQLTQQHLDSIQMVIYRSLTNQLPKLSMEQIMSMNGFSNMKESLIKELEEAGLKYTRKRMLDEMNSVMYKIRINDDGTEEYQNFIGFATYLYQVLIDGNRIANEKYSNAPRMMMDYTPTDDEIRSEHIRLEQENYRNWCLSNGIYYGTAIGGAVGAIMGMTSGSLIIPGAGSAIGMLNGFWTGKNWGIAIGFGVGYIYHEITERSHMQEYIDRWNLNQSGSSHTSNGFNGNTFWHDDKSWMSEDIFWGGLGGASGFVDDIFQGGSSSQSSMGPDFEAMTNSVHDIQSQ